MGFIKNFLNKRKANRLQSEAIDSEFDDRWADAAKDYAAEASLEMENELIFADDCLDSAKNWIKAGNREEALNQGRRALQGYMLGDWLKSDQDGEYLKTLTDLVGDLKRAGYAAEADALLTDINNALRSLGEKPVSLIVMTDENRFPADCPHCGATITYTGNLDTINCPFCNGVVHALDHPK